jgi:hypothetical protein
MARRFRTDCTVIHSTCPAIAQRLRSDGIAQQLRRDSAALVQRLQSDCVVFAQRPQKQSRCKYIVFALRLQRDPKAYGRRMQDFRKASEQRLQND